MRLVWQLAAVAAVAFIGGRGVMAVDGDPWLTLCIGVLTAVLSVPVYGWVVRRTERRTVTEVAPRGAAGAVVRGTLLGGTLFALVIVNIAFLEGYTVNGLGSPVGAVGLLGYMAAAAVTEEVMYRGVLFRIIEGRAGTWGSLLLTSVPFGLLHLLNENATLWGGVAVVIAGGMLAACYAATRSLWLPIGLHFGWNFAAGGVFSTEVSGNGTPQGLLDAEMSGPTLLTGGAFGPEGSLYSVVFCLLTMFAFLWSARRRGRLVPMRRRSARAADVTTLSR
ncbi:CPBP family intramembrane glutamic endopeptidase [Nocardiopsis composta]|uniref:CAAX prenyl protease 2/Lysostaphin resistance protein A-like domain-containing protein n=1 Tax=Nocardiopsis composta TaxID=157465 RepID=A0A7W8QPI8_9ACTN|nr:CPBP family intramembrane glutamic endopeptidase [Nocardiopsis composta]MBB5433518.1 hypothetical protein [Nocardiopsis composta]